MSCWICGDNVGTIQINKIYNLYSCRSCQTKIKNHNISVHKKNLIEAERLLKLNPDDPVLKYNTGYHQRELDKLTKKKKMNKIYYHLSKDEPEVLAKHIETVVKAQCLKSGDRSYSAKTQIQTLDENLAVISNLEETQIPIDEVIIMIASAFKKGYSYGLQDMPVPN